MPLAQFPTHKVLTGDSGHMIYDWLKELKQLAIATGCYTIIFPAEANGTPSSSEVDALARYQDGTHQALAVQLQTETACKLVTEYISGRVWAYMLALSSDPDVLITHPDQVVKWAIEAAKRMPLTPRSERELHRLRFELSHGSARDYPSPEHYEDGRAWLEVVCRKSAREEKMRWRAIHPGQRTPSPVRRTRAVRRASRALGFPIWDDEAMDVDRPEGSERKRVAEEEASPRRSSRRVRREPL